MFDIGIPEDLRRKLLFGIHRRDLKCRKGKFVVTLGDGGRRSLLNFGTSKGDMVVAIQKKPGIPIKFVGLGGKADDLQPSTRSSSHRRC